MAKSTQEQQEEVLAMVDKETESSFEATHLTLPVSTAHPEPFILYLQVAIDTILMHQSSMENPAKIEDKDWNERFISKLEHSS